MALDLGSKLFGDPRHGGRRGLIPLDESPQDLKVGKGGSEVSRGRIKKTQSWMDTAHSLVSPALPRQHKDSLS